MTMSLYCTCTCTCMYLWASILCPCSSQKLRNREKLLPFVIWWPIGLSSGGVVGAVLVGLLIVASVIVVGVMLVCYIKRKRMKQSGPSANPERWVPRIIVMVLVSSCIFYAFTICTYPVWKKVMLHTVVKVVMCLIKAVIRFCLMNQTQTAIIDWKDLMLTQISLPLPLDSPSFWSILWLFEDHQHFAYYTFFSLCTTMH